MVQVTSRALRIPTEKIHISETSTNTVPNATATTSSISSDLNGMAIANACQIIMQRLEPFKTAAPEDGWDKWVLAAYFDRVSLSATGFYKIPGLTYNPETNSGRAFNYYTFGAGCSEVEIDCLTGDHVKFGVAMGSPVSPIVVNLYMEDLELKIIATAPVDCQLRNRKRYVDVEICLVHAGKAKKLQQHMNTVDPTGSIIFTREDEENNSMPFLDAKFTRKEDGSVKSTVYRKKTHTDQYLNFASHHPNIRS
ncbi:Xanthine dehydrogenase/oxidase [Lamellibrachia satsuma]|nr:Xanthine dehydrogenase/oxidase [Lamellibrachia satsuma]